MRSRDLKMKKVESSIHLGIDSPLVMWFADLESLGLEDVLFTFGGGVNAGGTPQPEGGRRGGGDFDPIERYVAFCDEVWHPAETPGATADGRWIGALCDVYWDALGEASAHLHSSAYVALYVRGTFIGPVKVY